MVLGVVIPLTPNSAPVRVSTEIVRSLAPEFDTAMVELLCSAMLTDPKSTDGVLSEIWGCEETPIADKPTIAGLLPPSPCTVKVAVRFPGAVGFTVTEKLPVCPAANAMGVTTPLSENCGLEKLAWMILTGFVPVLAMETFWVV